MKVLPFQRHVGYLVEFCSLAMHHSKYGNVEWSSGRFPHQITTHVDWFTWTACKLKFHQSTRPLAFQMDRFCQLNVMLSTEILWKQFFGIFCARIHVERSPHDHQLKSPCQWPCLLCNAAEVEGAVGTTSHRQWWFVVPASHVHSYAVEIMHLQRDIDHVTVLNVFQTHTSENGEFVVSYMGFHDSITTDVIWRVCGSIVLKLQQSTLPFTFQMQWFCKRYYKVVSPVVWV